MSTAHGQTSGDKATTGQLLAERVAAFVGSW
jgi:hypothetical protein